MKTPTENLLAEGGGREELPGHPITVTSPRQRRLLLALMEGPKSRGGLDRLAGCANTPDIVFQLRARGLEIPCRTVQSRDRDGRPCHFGEYSLTAGDRAKVAFLAGGSNA
jgi:hypothetical protein